MIVHEGLRRMVGEQEDVFYYLTVMNENYPHPPLPEGAEEGILRGMHRIREMRGRRASGCSARARSCARSRRRPTCWPTTSAIEAEVWSVTSFTELRRDGLARDRERPPAARRPSRERAVGRRDCLGGQRGARGRRHRLHEGAPRRDPRLGPRPIRGARHRRLRPQRLPRATCGASSRSTATTSPSRRCRRSPPRARSSPRWSTDAIETYEIDPDAPDPAVSERDG